jgi:hypothetical protein
MNGPPTPCHSFQWPSPSPRHLLLWTFGSVGLGLPHAYEEPMSPVMTVRHQLRLSLSRILTGVSGVTDALMPVRGVSFTPSALRRGVSVSWSYCPPGYKQGL